MSNYFYWYFHTFDSFYFLTIPKSKSRITLSQSLAFCHLLEKVLSTELTISPRKQSYYPSSQGLPYQQFLHLRYEKHFPHNNHFLFQGTLTQCGQFLTKWNMLSQMLHIKISPITGLLFFIFHLFFIHYLYIYRLWHMRRAIARARLCTCLKHQRRAKKSSPCLIQKASRCAEDRTSKSTLLSFTLYKAHRSYKKIVCIYLLFHWFRVKIVLCIYIFFTQRTTDFNRLKRNMNDGTIFLLTSYCLINPKIFGSLFFLIRFK